MQGTTIIQQTNVTQSSREASMLFPNAYAVVIGVAGYPNLAPDEQLPGEVLQDALDVYDLLRSPEACGYNSMNVRLLLNELATAENVRRELQWLAETAGDQDTVMVFFSGHGWSNSTQTQSSNYLMAFDSDEKHLDTTALAEGELSTLLGSIPAQRLVVVFDSCFSAGVVRPIVTTGVSRELRFTQEFYSSLAQGRGRVVISSCESNERSYFRPGMKNSLFTHHFLASLNGSVVPAEGQHLGVLDVVRYVQREVPKAEPRQHPTYHATDVNDNYPIALYKGGKHRPPSPWPWVVGGAILVAIVIGLVLFFLNRPVKAMPNVGDSLPLKHDQVLTPDEYVRLEVKDDPNNPDAFHPNRWISYWLNAWKREWQYLKLVYKQDPPGDKDLFIFAAVTKPMNYDCSFKLKMEIHPKVNKLRGKAFLVRSTKETMHFRPIHLDEDRNEIDVRGFKPDDYILVIIRAGSNQKGAFDSGSFPFNLRVLEVY
jgi:hypothetical protein